MSTLTIHPANRDQETAIRMFLDALHVSYKSNGVETAETEYLSASQAMKERLLAAAEQDKNGEGASISLDDIWK